MMGGGSVLFSRMRIFSRDERFFSQIGELFADLRRKVLILRGGPRFREGDGFFSHYFLQCRQ